MASQEMAEGTVGRLDGYLTKKAQDVFGPSAQVIELTHENRREPVWILRREERDDLRLGGTFKLAREAVQALVRAEYRRQRGKEGATS